MAKNKLHKKRRELPMHDDLFTHRELHVRVSASRDLCLYGLDLFLGKKQTDLEQTQFPPPPLVSALLGSLMTAEWSPHYWEELAGNFLSMLLNNKWPHQTPPLTYRGLHKNEGNVRGQIKWGVGCLVHGWLPPLALKTLSSLLNTFH